MPATNINVIFDGVTSVPRLPGQGAVDWFDGFLGYYSVYDSTPTDDFTANVSLTGTDWTVAAMRFGAELNNTAVITDLNGDAGRSIDYLKLGSNSDVDLISTRVRYIQGDDGALHDVTLGSQNTNSVNLYAAQNNVTTGSGWVNAIDTGGASTIMIGSGGAGSVATGNGNDSVTTTTGYVGAIDTRGGRDTVTTGAEYVELIKAGDGNDTVNLGGGGSGAIRTGDGRDTVSTGAGYAELISTGQGDDRVNLGTGAAGIVRLGDGDDIIHLSEINPDFGVIIQGGAGSDTANFSAFTAGITFTLDGAGIFQNVAAPGGDLDVPALGYFAETGIDNVIATALADTLTGDQNANRLTGLAGNDRLFGGAAGDTLNGGKGNDRLFGEAGLDLLIGGKGRDILTGGAGKDMLRGNAGADIFVFGPGSGTDRVQDFADGIDILRIAGQTGGFGGLTISDQGNALKIVHDGGIILLNGEAGTTLTAADFEFV